MGQIQGRDIFGNAHDDTKSDIKLATKAQRHQENYFLIFWSLGVLVAKMQIYHTTCEINSLALQLLHDSTAITRMYISSFKKSKN
ncbi:MAG: hypothetical protein KKA19_09945 [Candidatus Margulisbacteria bacterium]|nr:hypothetical protein [Candidatus Margulisiibacteriota bacterium]